MNRYSATGEVWTTHDDVPRFEDKFFIHVQAESESDAERRVRLRMLPAVGFLTNVSIKEDVVRRW